MLYDPDDFYCFCRYREIELLHGPTRALRDYLRSSRRGKFRELIDRRRRKRFGPGKFWAASQSGWYLNANFVVGSGAYRVTHGE